MLSCRQAWKYAAELWADPTDEGCYVVCDLPINHTFRSLGICHTLTNMQLAGEISADTYVTMHRQLMSCQPPDTVAYFYDTDMAGAKKRAALCRKLARRRNP